jgi:zinc finger FYVE domain-containing protein 26
MDVCSDPLMMFSLIKSLILGAKMRYSDIIAAPSQSKGKPSRGLARCDALLGQIDLLSLLVSANCLHLLPPQPMSQLDTWRKLRDRLIDIELWSLALDVSTKAGLDAGSVWAAWGLVCLKAGNFQGNQT